MSVDGRSVFDEKRYFKPGAGNRLIKIKDLCFGVNICEDIWVESKGQPSEKIFKEADFLINISASPYHIDKTKERERVIGSKAKRFKIPIVYCNLIGGQDELVFDGRSALFWKDGKIIEEAKAFNTAVNSALLVKAEVISGFSSEKGKYLVQGSGGFLFRNR